jgi:ankyrin repeat protein
MPHTALYKAAKRGDLIEVRRLLSEGSDPNGASVGESPLVAAAGRGHTPIVTLLIAAGAKPDRFALVMAAFGNHAKTVQVLLEAGASDAGEKIPLLNMLKYSGTPLENQQHVRQLLRDAGARELPDGSLRWHWALSSAWGWRWRLRRLLLSVVRRRT